MGNSLSEILQSYSNEKPKKLDFFDIVKNYKLIRNYIVLKEGDIVLNSNLDSDDITDIFFDDSDDTNLMQEANNNTWGLEVMKDYKEDNLLNYLLRKGQESSKYYTGLERLIRISNSVYNNLITNVFKDYKGYERDGEIYPLGYLFYKGSVECLKISTILCLILTMDKDFKKEGVKFKLGGKFIDTYGSGTKDIKSKEDNISHAWVNAYFPNGEVYIIDPINKIFINKDTAKKGIKVENKFWFYHYNSKDMVIIRKNRYLS
ncbi:hypothetical protein M1558_01320 [Candidatus Parvarchaeota archaeon]|nr:hypothetical protein [Candidatus Parvarchaeota archaeon]